MSKGNGDVDSLAGQLRDSGSIREANKPDFRELDLGSPVSPLRNTRASAASRNTHNTSVNAATTTSSSSGSSGGSVSGSRRAPNSMPHLSKSAGNSGELGIPSKRAGGHTRSDSLGNSGGLTGSSGSIGSTGTLSSATSPTTTTNVLPAGNICPSGRIVKTGMASKSTKSDVLGTGTGNYGHGSIMRGGSGNLGSSSTSFRGGMDPEDLKRMGNEMYKKGFYEEALGYYDKAIGLFPSNAAYRSNRASALVGLGKLGEAVKEFEDAIALDPKYWRADHRLGSLFLKLGLVENAKKHILTTAQPAELEVMHKLQNVEKHVKACGEARKMSNWITVLKESEAAISAGADSSPLLVTCKGEAFLRLHRLQEADRCLSSLPKFNPLTPSCLHHRAFGLYSQAYVFMVQAEIDLAMGRFEKAVQQAEKSNELDKTNLETAEFLNNVKVVARARARGNDLFKAERFTEACAAYSEGLRISPSNSVLYCNRAACWSKVGAWERAIEDCNWALRYQPNYPKALLRRAASYSKVEKWSECVADYVALRRILPDDNDIAESLFHAQVALKKSRGEEVYNLKFGGEVEEITTLEHFRTAVSLPGVSVVHFKSSSDNQSRQLSQFVDRICCRYPSVDMEGAAVVAREENVRVASTFKIYKNGVRVKEMVCPSCDMLEHSVRHYSF